MKKFFDNKIVVFITSTIEWITTIILICLIILAAFQKFSNQQNLFGYRIYTVASGSMIPIYNVGDTLLIKDMGPEHINVGDAVTYMGETGDMHGVIITHQVQAKVKGKDGKYYFHTKGVANNIEDPIVSEDQVFGKVVHKFFFLSLIGVITTSMPLLLIFIVVPMAFLIGIELVKLVYKSSDEDEDEDDSSEDVLEDNETEETNENVNTEETNEDEDKKENSESEIEDLENDQDE